MSAGGNDFASRFAPRANQFARPALAVLIVDPDTENANQLAKAISGRCMVAVAPGAQHALAAMRQRMPDLIVAELDLPDASGLEFITTIHSTPATRNVLLMVVTRRAAIRDKIAAFQAGADDYLVKPVEGQLFEIHVQLLSRFRQTIQNTTFGPP
ncbi:MAG: response regulator [Ktedonobacterales bacterium]